MRKCDDINLLKLSLDCETKRAWSEPNQSPSDPLGRPSILPSHPDLRSNTRFLPSLSCKCLGHPNNPSKKGKHLTKERPKTRKREGEEGSQPICIFSAGYKSRWGKEMLTSGKRGGNIFVLLVIIVLQANTHEKRGGDANFALSTTLVSMPQHNHVKKLYSGQHLRKKNVGVRPVISHLYIYVW